jgi:hypothetical protein
MHGEKDNETIPSSGFAVIEIKKGTLRPELDKKVADLLVMEATSEKRPRKRLITQPWPASRKVCVD